jgi:hypothetical protein
VSQPDTELGRFWKQTIRDHQDPSIAALDLATSAHLLPPLLPVYVPPGLKRLSIWGEAAVDYDAINVSIKIQLSHQLDVAGEPAHWMSRRILEKARRAEHRNLYLPPMHQNQGVAREMWRRAIHMYDQLGFIETVIVESERVGRYANTAAGVDFLDDEQRVTVIEAVERVAAITSCQVDTSPLVHSWNVAAIPNRVDLDVLRAAGLTMDPEAVWTDPARVPLGRATLLSSACPPWRGMVELRDGAASYRRLREYIS